MANVIHGEREYLYTIFRVGDMYYAENRLTGKIDYCGVDAATVIQSAVDRAKETHGFEETQPSANVNRVVVALRKPIYDLLAPYSEKMGYTWVGHFLSDLCTAKAMALLGLGSKEEKP